MKNLGILCAALVLVAGMVASASAAERTASVSNSALASMGMGSMQVMTDHDGLAIRGKGCQQSQIQNFHKSCSSSCQPKPVCHPQPVCHQSCNPCSILRSVCSTPGRVLK